MPPVTELTGLTSSGDDTEDAELEQQTGWRGRGTRSKRIVLLLALGAAAMWVAVRAVQVITDTCPVPRLSWSADGLCERVFAARSAAPCELGKHSGLCLDMTARALSSSELDATFAAHPEMARVQIISNRIYFIEPGRGRGNAPIDKTHRVLRRHLRHIAAAANLTRLADVDFILCIGDGAPAWPVFAHAAKLETQKGERGFAIPTDVGVPKATKLPSGRHCAPAGRDEREGWQRKQDKLCFRGSPTGPPVTLGSWSSNIRARLSALSALWPELLDAKLIKFNDDPERNSSEQAILQRSVLDVGKFMPMRSSANYKFVIDVDGHSQANRFPFLLHLGPIVLQVILIIIIIIIIILIIAYYY
ncbi:hypothetical protein T492DRAFT_505866 [Pavlovales sp. CCMP2436]|nr:hypothetical protein T492DRAFT_505866 [Pavlovales sp. CCMP2436]